MSRFLLACSFVAALTSTAAAQRFAQPPAAMPVTLDAKVTPEDFGQRLMPTRAQLRVKLAQNRKDNLARFRAYQIKGVFPNNTFTSNKLNVWIDAAGNLCAAATIINASGQSDLVQATGVSNNFIRLADVSSGPLMDWILTSGFTQAEIVAIQEPFMGVNGDLEPRWAGRTNVDPTLRAAEDKRLKKHYKQVDATLVKQQKKSLDAAVDRLMQHPTLAYQLMAS